jgi:branched-chain amino acid transport system substrate-binding protein
MRRLPRTIVVLLATVSLAAVACGQKPGVVDVAKPPQHLAGGLPPGAQIDPETGEILDSEGNVIGTVPGGASLPGEPGTTGGPGGSAAEDTSAGASGPGGGDPTDGSVDGSTPPDGGSAVGVTADAIKIGAHAPLTGAAPVPSDSAEKAVDVYWKWLAREEKLIHGRRVEAILKNDNYNPSQAVAACKEMVEKDQVFMLFGFAGTDQILACARYAASVGVPYVSVGVAETYVSSLRNYFAVSATYRHQGELLADLLHSQLGARSEKNGMLWFDTASFEDAHDGFVAAMEKRGTELAYDRAVSKSASASEAQAVVQQMRTLGIENVYVNTSPLWFLQVLQAAQSQGYSPQWVGVGITKALDTVASVGCRNGTLNRAKFFSPFPAWVDIDRFDPNFKRAVQTVYPEKGGGDDIMLIGWSMSKVLGELFERAGRSLTREGLIYAAERARNVKTGVFPPVSFTPEDHLGGDQVHLNEAQCSGYKAGDNRWHTIQSFVSDF